MDEIGSWNGLGKGAVDEGGLRRMSGTSAADGSSCHMLSTGAASIVIAVVIGRARNNPLNMEMSHSLHVWVSWTMLLSGPVESTGVRAGAC